MASKYRTIGGVKYERDLLELAEQRAAAGSLRKAEAVELWEQAMDGGCVTPTEARTLMHIMNSHKFDRAARSFLEDKLREHPQALAPPAAQSSTLVANSQRRKSNQYYTYVDGLRCDKALLEEAQEHARRGALSLDAATSLWANAHDGRGVTDTERRTLQHVVENFRLDADAERFLRRVLKMEPRPQNGAPSLPAPEAGGAGVLTTQRPMEAVIGPEAAEAVEAAAGAVAAAGNALRALAAPLAAVRGWLGGGKKRPCEEAPPVAPATKRPALEAGASAASAARGAAGAEEPREARGAAALLGGLSEELRDLLREGENSSQPAALEWPFAPAPEEADDLGQQRAKVQEEVDRILAARRATEILGNGSREEQHRQFKRIALLLHPDKGLVPKDDARAALAMQLALVALRRARHGA